MKMKNIPWASPHYWGNEERYVVDALQSSWISGGAYVERLEEDFARYCDVPYAIAASKHCIWLTLHLIYVRGTRL
jgi:perosamine synthetase